jgi:multidrug efflux pump subunit AcrB
MKDPDQIAAGLTGKVSQVKDANAFFFNFPTVQGFGNVSGFEFMLQDKTNGSFEQLGTTTQAFIGELMKRPELHLLLQLMQQEIHNIRLMLIMIKPINWVFQLQN